MKQLLLLITSYLFIIPIIYNKIYNHSANNIEKYLFAMLFIAWECSQLFWNNPVRYSIIHNIDGFVAKFTIGTFIIYTIFIKENKSYIYYRHFFSVLSSVFTSAYLSNYFSKIEWCGDLHIYYHGLLHICCFIASLFAFM